MTRKDYIALAEAFRYARGHAKASENPEAELTGVMAALEYVSNTLQDDNPRFDRIHFLEVVVGTKDLQSRPPRKPTTGGLPVDRQGLAL